MPCGVPIFPPGLSPIAFRAEDLHHHTMTSAISTLPAPRPPGAAIPLPPPAGLAAPAPAVAPVGFYDREPLAGAIRTARHTNIDPITFAEQLREAGWPDLVAQAAADRIVQRDRHRVAWVAWYGALGTIVATVAAAAHVGLQAAGRHKMTFASGSAIATMLTIALVATPIALWGRWHLRNAVDGPGRWSPTRRTLIEAMLWTTALVAIARSLIYVSVILRAILVPGAPPLTTWDFAQVLVTITAAGSLFRYGWHQRTSVRTGRHS